MNKQINYKNQLTPIKSKIKKNKYIGFDIETIDVDNQQVFYFGSIVNDKIKKVFFDKKEFIKEILKPKYSTYIFVATNLSFDFTGLFEKTPEFNLFKKIFRGSDLLCCNYKIDKKGTIKFIDTFNYVHFSVKKLGELINIHKLVAPEYMGKRKSKTKEELNKFIDYNIRDSYISCKFMEFLQDGTNKLGGNLKLTIASSTLDVFKRNYLIFPLIKETEVLKDDSVNTLIREAYYGGRTEVFKKGVFRFVNYYDINSLYPSQMLKEIPIPNSVKKIDKPDIINIINYEGVTKCRVIATDIDKPLLPLRCSKTKKLLFPIGEFISSYNHNELREALKLGYKIFPIEQIIYTKTQKLFKRYITELYNLRLQYKKENSSMELIIKLYLNSLYGKFGQSNKTETNILYIDSLSKEEKIKINLHNTNYDIKNNIAISNEHSEYDGSHALPIISSYITSYARLELYKYIQKYDPIYCDTDSIVTEHTLPTSDKLGDMKLEGVVEECEFYKPKFYYMKMEDSKDYIIKIKGVTRCSFEELQELKNYKSVSRFKFSKIKESVRRGINYNTIINVEKNINLDDTKRLWFGDISVPLYINEK